MTTVQVETDSGQWLRYPSTRFMGSKQKLVGEIWDVARQFDVETAMDLFAGSGTVSYLFKSHGLRVVSNDHMYMSWHYARAMVENNKRRLSESQVDWLISEQRTMNDRFVEENFAGLYYSDEDNRLIDRIRSNISGLSHPIDRSIATAALMRACAKKRPRGIFTYVGFRYDDGRKDLRRPLDEHFRLAVAAINDAVFSNGRRNVARCGDVFEVPPLRNALVYMDPPYFSPLSDNEYVRRYHFLEGIARGWEGVSIQGHTKTKKFASYRTPFSSREGALSAFDRLFRKFRRNYLLVSYSSNGLPTMDEIMSVMSKYKTTVEVVPVNYRYSFGNQGHKRDDNRNAVREYLFVGH